MDEHEFLDQGAKIELILQGIRYAIVFQDIDVLRKAVIDLQDCVDIMNNMVEDAFGTE